MAINRFYNQSLPVYTSQFVEDKTPWEEMIGFEQTKLQRADVAQETAGKVDALTSSIQEGLRTQELAPIVRERYKKKLNDWQKTYVDTGNMANVHAIRDLTKINAEFLGDPDVNLISKDAADSELYKRMALQKKMGEYDTNLDPITGELRQFKSKDQYEGYNSFVDPVGYFREQYEKLPVHENGTSYFVDKPILDANGKPLLNENQEQEIIRTMVEVSSKIRKPSDLRLVTENKAKEILENRGSELNAFAVWLKKPVSEITKEDIVGVMKTYEDEYLEFDRRENSTIVGTRAAGSGKPPVNPAFTGPSPIGAEEVAESNVSFKPGTGGLNIMERIVAEKDEGNAFKGAAGTFVESMKQTGENIVDVFKFNKDGEESKDKKADNIGNVGPLYESENDELAALALLKAEGLYLKEDFPFKDKNDPTNKVAGLKVFMDTPSEEWTDQQKIYVAKQVNQIIKDKTKQVVSPNVISLNETDEKYFQDKYGVGVSEANIGAADNQAGALFMGATIIDPTGKVKKSTKEFTDKEKAALIEKGGIFKINGIVEPGTSQFGNDFLSVTVGNAHLYLKMDNEYTRSRKLFDEINSANLPNNYGTTGNIFRVNDVQDWLAPIDINTKYDNSAHNPNAVYMQSRKNPKNQTWELLVYDKNPEKKDAKAKVYKLSPEGKNPSPLTIQYLVSEKYLERMQNLATDTAVKSQLDTYRKDMFDQYKELISQDNGQK